MAKNDPVGWVICDAGPLIHLHELHCIDLLADFHHVLVPSAVWSEVALHRPDALRSPRVALERVPRPEQYSVELTTVVSLLGLHEGERQALGLMLQHPDAMLLTDDSAARLAAARMNLKVHGTIGILVRAIRRRQKSPEQIISLLEAIPQRSSLHVRARLIEWAVDQIRSL